MHIECVRIDAVRKKSENASVKCPKCQATIQDWELNEYYKPEWNLEKGALELLNFFKKINFTEQQFRGPSTNRLQHLSKFISENKIDKNFRKII